MMFYLTGQYKNKEKQIINNKWTTEILIRSRNTKNSLLNNLKEIFQVKFSFITKNLWKVFQTRTAYCPLYSFWLFFDSAFSIATSCGRGVLSWLFHWWIKSGQRKKDLRKNLRALRFNLANRKTSSLRRRLSPLFRESQMRRETNRHGEYNN